MQGQKEGKKVKNKAFLLVKIPKDLKLKIQKDIHGVMSLKNYVVANLLHDLEYFDDELLVLINQRAKLEKKSMRDLVRLKLGLIDFAPPFGHYKASEYAKSMHPIDLEDKAKIDERAKRLRISITSYGIIKFIAMDELANIFSFDELQRLKGEAKKHGMDLKEYINTRLRH